MSHTHRGEVGHSCRGEVGAVKKTVGLKKVRICFVMLHTQVLQQKIGFVVVSVTTGAMRPAQLELGAQHYILIVVSECCPRGLVVFCGYL